MPFQGTHFFGATPFFNGVATRSLRSPYGADPLLSRTPSSAGNRKIYTISLWFKRATLSNGALLSAPINASLNGFSVYFDSDKLTVFEYKDTGQSSYWKFESTREFRDTSNWYHMVLYWQTDTYSSDADSIRVYINGSQISGSFTGSVGADYQSLTWNNTYVHEIFNQRSTTFDYDGYMAEFNFIDGQALTPTSFGETKNGVWIPKDTSGLTFGTNGVRLEFKQVGTGGASASTIGADTSGNGNHFTDAGLAAHNSNMLDCCENNFATTLGNGLAEPSDYQSYNNPVSSEGNLKVTSQTGWTNGSSNFGMTSGKWYAECRINAVAGSNYIRFGMRSRPARTYDEYFWTDNGGGQIDGTTSPYSDRVGTYGAGDILQIALDLENNAVYFGKNNTWQNSATATEIANGTVTNAFASGTTLIPNAGADGDGHAYFFYCNPHPSGSNITWNFGQDSSFAGLETAQGNSDSGDSVTDFYYTPPDGFLACNATNLADTTLSPNQAEQATDHFNTVLYTGTGTSGNAVTVGFQTDWLWIKRRNGDTSHRLIDSSRGADRYLSSDTTNAEDDATGIFTSFDTNGFTVEGTGNATNGNTNTYVSWNWKANGGTTVSNTDGTITSTVQVNQKAGFSIVTYTSNNTAGATVGHGLGKAPAMIITKNREDARNWGVYHHKIASDPETDAIFLNLANASSDNSAYWNDTAPTSTVFSLGSGAGETNFPSSDGFVAYCFAEIEGYSKFGVYEGNSNADGTYIFTGFRPAVIIFKNIDGSDEWVIGDNKRDPSNTVVGQLFPSTNGQESRANNICDFLSNGFKMRRNAGSINQSTHIYMAWAESPFKFSNAR